MISGTASFSSLEWGIETDDSFWQTAQHDESMWPQNPAARGFHELFLPRLVVSLSGLSRHGDGFRNRMFSLHLCSPIRFIIRHETREENTIKINCINRVQTVKSSNNLCVMSSWNFLLQWLIHLEVCWIHTCYLSTKEDIWPGSFMESTQKPSRYHVS